jgi:acetyl-CoA carboxylase biotin carboxyl carrier protein
LSEQRIRSEIAGSVWKILANAGDKVEEEDQIMILESMKMEIPVLAPDAGTVRKILVQEGEAVGEGQVVAILD